MKTTIVSLIIFLCGHIAFATDKYIEIMQKNIATVYTASDIIELQAAVNAFERMGAAEKTKWEPYYYEAFGYVMMSIRSKENGVKDDYLDRAEIAVNKAKEIVPGESEVITMVGFIQMMKINVDPSTRGAKDSGKVMSALKKAIDLDGNNPRALAMLAQMQYGTAKFLNASTAEACALADRASEKFTVFKSDNPLAPRWGKAMVDELRAKCQK